MSDEWDYRDFIEYDPEDYSHLDDLDQLPIESDTELSDQLDHRMGVGDRLRETIIDTDGIDAATHPTLIEQLQLDEHLAELRYTLVRRPDIGREARLDHLRQMSRLLHRQSVKLVELLAVLDKNDLDPADLPDHAGDHTAAE